MGEGLAAETEDPTVTEGFARLDAGIIDQKLHREIVGTIDDEVVVLDDIHDVVTVKERMDGIDLDVGVDGFHLLLGALDLRTPHILREMDDLSLEVAQIHDIAVDNADRSYTGSSEIHGGRGSEATRTDDKHFGVEDLLLTLQADILKENVAAVTLYLRFSEIDHAAPPPMK